jgi:hypothetical protein
MYTSAGCCPGDGTCCLCVAPGFCDYITFNVTGVSAFTECVCTVCDCAAGCEVNGSVDQFCSECAYTAASGPCSADFAQCPLAVAECTADSCAAAVSLPSIGSCPAPEARDGGLSAYQAYVACAQQECSKECVLVIVYDHGPNQACADCMADRCNNALSTCLQN